MKKDEGSSGFESQEPDDPDNHETHAHFFCVGCQTGFCSKHPDFADMKDGDNCPECHIATVTEVKLQRMDGLPPGMRDVLDDVLGTIEEQNRVARTLRLVEAATRLYPYVAHTFPAPEEAGVFKAGGEITDSDIARSLRCVDIVMGMEAAIQARITKQQEQEQGE